MKSRARKIIGKLSQKNIYKADNLKRILYKMDMCFSATL